MVFYVSMTDTFLSGWGEAEGKTAKYVVKCQTYEQAKQIKRNAEKRSDMKNIRIGTKKPTFKGSQVTYRNYDDLSGMWKD